MATPKKPAASRPAANKTTPQQQITTPTGAGPKTSIALTPTSGTEVKQAFPQLPLAVAPVQLVPDDLKGLGVEKLLQAGLINPLKLYSLNAGCYLVNMQLTGLGYHYDGTIRVEKQGANTIASGDLYYHKPISVWPTLPVRSAGLAGSIGTIPGLSFAGQEPNPGNGIPVFARDKYRYYLRITALLEGISLSNTFTMGFEMWRFNGVSSSPMWSNEGAFTAKLTFGTAPASYPSGADYLTGAILNSQGAQVGTLTMGWLTKYLRRATVEIDRVSVSEAPVDSGAGHTWQGVFDPVGWQLNVVQSNSNVTEASGESWSDGEMHSAMLTWRDSANLDNEWRYHILAVKKIDSTPRGIMYDSGATDSNNVPREGIGIASHWVIPNSSEWGKVKNMRFGTAKAPYFRTALHEIGHAMGLYHNTVDMGIMNTTDVISLSAVPPTQFPDNIKWAHAPDDQKRLRHMPDIYVRPGGVAFGTAYSVHPLSPDDEHEEAEGLELRLRPVNDVLPIGAPVRVEMELVNVSSIPLPAPESLNMKYGCVAGKITDAAGTVRRFSTLIMCVDEVTIAYLQPGQRIGNALTLLRGSDGALFPTPGAYTVEVSVSWELGDNHVSVTSQTSVYVASAVNEEHARAALKVLSTPDTLLSLVLTGDHLEEGNRAIRTALDNPVLRPYFCYIEAKRLVQPFHGRKAAPAQAAKMLNKETVMNSAELKKATAIFTAAGNTNRADGSSSYGAVLAMLQQKSDDSAKDVAEME